MRGDLAKSLKKLSETMIKDDIPRGFKYPNGRGLGPKLPTLNGIGDLKPYYLGTWTLWVIP